MSLDQTPSPASVDFDPPAYSQPTLPPPADEEPVAPTRISRWGTRILVAGFVGVAGLTGAAFALAPHVEPSAAAASLSIKPTDTRLSVSLPELVAAFPSQVSETPCAEPADHVPVVLYSAVGGTPSKLESEIFSSALTTSGKTVSIPGRRIAVVRTFDNHGPETSARELAPGHYAGAIVVFDAATRQPLCQAKIDASSTRDLRWANVSDYGLEQDYVANVRKEVQEMDSRLRVDLDL